MVSTGGFDAISSAFSCAYSSSLILPVSANFVSRSRPSSFVEPSEGIHESSTKAANFLSFHQVAPSTAMPRLFQSRR